MLRRDKMKNVNKLILASMLSFVLILTSVPTGDVINRDPDMGTFD